MGVNFVNLAGLMYDIVGAFLLGRAVVFNSKEKIAQQVATTWDYNKELIGVVVEGRVEAVVGLALLICGFLLQGASAFANGDQWEFGAALALLVAGVITHRMTLPYFVRRGTERVVAFMRAQDPNASFIEGRESLS